MARLKAIILIALGIGILGSVSAQNLDMSGAEGSNTFDQPGKPTRGMTQERVRANFGEPISTVPAVGDPPISRWNYSGFVVFFEYDKVIHSVTIR
ncbi:MAG: hypothetical protein R3192_07170 [Woeseiaceae bacterium]|nr:hypothetical protein [Woeseiaceae bacterium]